MRFGLWSHGVPYIEKFALVNSNGQNISSTFKQTIVKEGLKTKNTFFSPRNLVASEPYSGYAQHSVSSCSQLVVSDFWFLKIRLFLTCVT